MERRKLIASCGSFEFMHVLIQMYNGRMTFYVLLSYQPTPVHNGKKLIGMSTIKPMNFSIFYIQVAVLICFLILL
jgi:hypothetical protein